MAVAAAAVAAGATTINVPDTVGYTSPVEYAALMEFLKEHVPGVEKAVISVHCHDDLGMATANTLVACQAGASGIIGTFGGLGERTGNVCNEEIAVALTYIRLSWGHQAAPVKPEAVHSVRDWSQARRDGWTEPELLKLR